MKLDEQRFATLFAAKSSLARSLVSQLVERGLQPEEISPPSDWLLDIEVWCRRCGTYGKARMIVATFPEFKRQLEAGKLRCDNVLDNSLVCGGSLDDKQHLILET